MNRYPCWYMLPSQRLDSVILFVKEVMDSHINHICSADYDINKCTLRIQQELHFTIMQRSQIDQEGSQCQVQPN